jgi:hypothetical protein
MDPGFLFDIHAYLQKSDTQSLKETLSPSLAVSTSDSAFKASESGHRPTDLRRKKKEEKKTTSLFRI